MCHCKIPPTCGSPSVIDGLCHDLPLSHPQRRNCPVRACRREKEQELEGRKERFDLLVLIALDYIYATLNRAGDKVLLTTLGVAAMPVISFSK